MILKWLIFSSYTLKRENRPLTPTATTPFGRRPVQLSAFRIQPSVFAGLCSLCSRGGGKSLLSLFLTLTLQHRPNPVRALRSPTHTPSLASSYAVAPDHARFGVRSSSGRVGVRYTALRRASLRLVRFPQLLVRHWHVWLASSFTSFTSRARSHMVHSQYQHGPRLFFDKESFFVVLVLLHAIPPGGFCSSLLRRPHLPHGARPLRWLFTLCGDSVFFSADSSHGVHYHFIHMLAIATKFISVAVQPFVPTQRRSCSNILRFLFLRPLLYLILLGFLRHA